MQQNIGNAKKGNKTWDILPEKTLKSEKLNQKLSLLEPPQISFFFWRK